MSAVFEINNEGWKYEISVICLEDVLSGKVENWNCRASA